LPRLVMALRRGDESAPRGALEIACYQLSPGMAVAGGGALTGGVNRLPPVGLIDFSVGVTEGAGDDVDGAVVLVVDDVSGAFSSLLPHAAVSPTIAMRAAPPTDAAMRRPRRRELMLQSYPTIPE
jgi:hypothetical protein